MTKPTRTPFDDSRRPRRADSEFAHLEPADPAIEVNDKREIRRHAKDFSFNPCGASLPKRAPRNTETDTLSRAGGLGFLADVLFGGGGGGGGGGPDAIERQEREGQRDAVASDTLPSKGLLATNEAGERIFEKMGVQIDEPVPGDTLFIFVTLPAGWKRRPTSHSMQNELVDDRGRVRATFFYKAAFYDRDAHILASRRFGTDTEPVDEKHYGKAHYGIVKDSGREIARLGPFEAEAPDPFDVSAVHKRASEVARDAATAWLKEHYPDFADPLAYWD